MLHPISEILEIGDGYRLSLNSSNSSEVIKIKLKPKQSILNQASSRVIKGHQGSSRVIKHHQVSSSIIKLHQVSSIFSVAKATLHSQMSVHLFVRLSGSKTPQQLEIIILHHSSFTIHPASFFIHPSSFFIHPSFISRLLSFSACLMKQHSKTCPQASSSMVIIDPFF